MKITRFGIKKKEKLLLILLFFIVLITRLQFTFHTDYDSYWIHGMAESINIYGYAKWVFHPASLFGYYPFAYPSALMFFLAFFSSISGLTMLSTVHLIGIFLGALGTLLVFILARKVSGFFMGYLSALIFALSPQVIYYSSFIASGRYFLVIFNLLLLLLIINIFELIFGKSVYLFEDSFEKDFPKRRQVINMIVISIFVLLFVFMIHRTSQLVILIVLSSIFTYLLFIIKKNFNKISMVPFVKKYFIERYKEWDKWIFLDLCIVLLSILLIKFVDLYSRGRFLINIGTKLPFLLHILYNLNQYLSNYTILSVIFLIAFIDLLVLIFILSKKLRHKMLLDFLNRTYIRMYNSITKKFSNYFFVVLFLISIYLFIIQFFGQSFYSPSLEDYSENLLIKSENPLFKLINFVFNFSTSVTILSVFSVVGVIFLFLKKNKNILEVLFMFIFLLFAS